MGTTDRPTNRPAVVRLQGRTTRCGQRSTATGRHLASCPRHCPLIWTPFKDAIVTIIILDTFDPCLFIYGLCLSPSTQFSVSGPKHLAMTSFSVSQQLFLVSERKR